GRKRMSQEVRPDRAALERRDAEPRDDTPDVPRGHLPPAAVEEDRAGIVRPVSLRQVRTSVVHICGNRSGGGIGEWDDPIASAFTLLHTQPAFARIDLVVAQRARFSGTETGVVQQLDEGEIAPGFRRYLVRVYSFLGSREHPPDLV